jgi:hypothetical protein
MHLICPLHTQQYVATAGSTRPLQVDRLEQMEQCLVDGLRSRVTAATLANVHSSRSHAIYTVRVRQVRRARAGSSAQEDGTASTAETPESSSRMLVKHRRNTQVSCLAHADASSGMMARGAHGWTFAREASCCRPQHAAICMLLQELADVHLDASFAWA